MTSLITLIVRSCPALPDRNAAVLTFRGSDRVPCRRSSDQPVDAEGTCRSWTSGQGLPASLHMTYRNGTMLRARPVPDGDERPPCWAAITLITSSGETDDREAVHARFLRAMNTWLTAEEVTWSWH